MQRTIQSRVGQIVGEQQGTPRDHRGHIVPKRVLVVDDDQGLLRLLTVRLAAIGFAVTTCTTGEGALAIAHHESFDLAITDLYLPGQDGLAVMEELQRIHPSLPVLILTAHGSIPNAVEAMQKGA